MRGPHEYDFASGDGVITPGRSAKPDHQRGTSREPHCDLKRCVPPLGVQRPKLNTFNWRSIARSMKAQYKCMLAAISLYSINAEAHVTSNSEAHCRPAMQAIGLS